jgi:uncharacterized delta-60 repeat protein
MPLIARPGFLRRSLLGLACLLAMGSLAQAQAPTITTQPADLLATAGQPATLTVAATGASPLTYQWRRNGFVLTGATAASYTLANTTRTDADLYDVLVTNSVATVTSASARLAVAPTAYPAAVALDPSSNLVLENSTSGSVFRVLALADGKFLAVGDFSNVSGVPRSRVARFNADSTLDTAFVPPVFSWGLRAVTLQPDGKILVGGRAGLDRGIPRSGITRLHADGSLDPTFNLGGAGNGDVWDIRVASGGKILVAGSFNTFNDLNGPGRMYLTRVNADGSLDATFSPSLPNGIVRTAVPLADGKILIGGDFTTIGGIARNRIARLGDDGTLDTAFDPGIGANNSVGFIFPQSDGMIVVAGDFSNFSGNGVGRVARLTATGSFDASFAAGAGFNSSITGMIQLSDGRFVAGGYFWEVNGTARSGLARLSSNGVLDLTFAASVNQAVFALAVSTDGRVVVGGLFDTVAGQPRHRLARLAPNGALDPADAVVALRFPVNPPYYGNAVTIFPVAGGKQLLFGNFSHVGGSAAAKVARLNSDGTLDETFMLSPLASADYSVAALQADGKVVIGGSNGPNSLVRLSTDGSIDPAFNVGVGPINLRQMVALPGGSVLLVGAFTEVLGTPRNRIARLAANGSLDLSYNPNFGSDTGGITCAAVQRDGKVVVGGYFSSFAGQPRTHIARLHADGSLDTAFNPVSNGQVDAILLQPDGKILLRGYFTQMAGASSNGLARLNADGSNDSTFQTVVYGANSPGMHLQEDGRLIAVGHYGRLNSDPATAFVVRVTATGSVDSSFAGIGLVSPFKSVVMRDNGQFSFVGDYPLGYGRTIPASAPVITAQPVAQTAGAGGTVTFSVAAAATPAAAYQWNFNGVPLAGATSATLTLANVTAAHAGTYTVTVTNGFGSVTSAAATLSGSAPAPTITAQPAHILATAGQPATLTVAATGTGSLTYQWRRNGFILPGATAASYTLASASRTDADTYDVVIADGLSTVTSASARLAVAPTAYPSAVTLDPTATLALESTAAGAVYRALALPDGKFLALGEFSNVNGVPRSRVARFNADSTLDLTFVPPVFSAYLRTIAQQPDGKILVGGGSGTVDGVARGGISRLNADGSLDNTFNPGSGAQGDVRDIRVLGSGKLLVAGSFFSFAGNTGSGRTYLVRLNADGAHDATFTPATPSSGVRTIVPLADGKLLLGGEFTNLGGTARNRVARLNADGSLDATFDPGTGANGAVEFILPQADGTLIAAGDFSSFNGNAVGRIVRLTAAGAYDATFAAGTGFSSSVQGLIQLSDGRLIAAGSFGSVNGASRYALARLSANGVLDPAFAPSVNSSVLALAATSGGSLLVGGYFDTVSSQPRGRLARLNADGTLDSTAVAVTTRYPMNSVTLVPLPGGKQLLVGGFTHVGAAPATKVARLNADGSLDPAFTLGATATGPYFLAAVQTDGRIVIGGNSGGNALLRLHADGAVDSSFSAGTGPNNSVTQLFSLPGGRVLLAGSFSSVNGTARAGLARLNADGSVDLSFNPGTAASLGSIRHAAVQADGKILIGGYFTSVAGVTRNRLARLHADGALDTGFDPNSDGQINQVVLQPDGKLLVAGYFNSIGGTSRQGLARLNADGTVDGTFLNTVYGGNFTGLHLQEDGRFLVYGHGGTLNNVAGTAYLARLTNAGALDPAFASVGISVPIRNLVMRDDGQLSFVGDYPLGYGRTIPASAPAIAAQPLNQTASAGGTVGFSVTATGTPAPTFQWYRNGLALTGATNAALTRSSVTIADVGTYWVVVTNGLGSTTSAPVTLSGSDEAPTLDTQPANQTALAGESATFSVAASGSGELAYQWRRNGVPISGATQDTLTLNNVSRADEDWYDVQVSVGLTGTVSDPARLTVAPASYPQVLGFDGSFNLRLERANGEGHAKVLSLPDNRYYIAGGFTSVDGTPRTRVARFTAAGALDSTFLPPAIDGRVRALAVDTEGRLVIGGAFTVVGAHASARLARLNGDGSVDTAFTVGSTLNSEVSEVIVLPDGRIVASGFFTNVAGSGRNFLARFTATGTLDLSFNAGVNNSFSALARQADGKLVIGGSFTQIGGVSRGRIARLEADGALDLTFAAGAAFDSQVNALSVQSDGKIVVGGYFSTYNGTATGRLTRLNPDGTLDSTFVSNVTFNSVTTLALSAADQIFVAGNYFTVAGSYVGELVRLGATGTRDTIFNASSSLFGVSSLSVETSGRLLAAGSFSASGSLPARFVRLESTGAIDVSSARAWRFPAFVNTLAHAPGGKVYVAGDITHAGGIASAPILRLTAEGSIDPTFSPVLTGSVSRAAVQPDGRIVIVGSTNRGNLARLNSDGTVDATFNAVGAPSFSASALAILPGGRIAVTGFFSSWNGTNLNGLAVLQPTGALDATFAGAGVGPAGFGQINALLPEPDGKLLVGGSFTTFHGQPRSRLVRLNADGVLDTTFSNAAVTDGNVTSALVLPDRRLIVGLSFNGSDGTPLVSALRLSPAGVVDYAFAPALSSSGGVRAMLAQADGAFLFANGSPWAGQPNSFGLTRALADGSYDPTLNLPVASSPPTALLLLDDGRLLLAAQSLSIRTPQGTLASFETLARTTSQPGPVIIQQPVATTVLAGANVTLSTTVVGAAVSYQWRLNGTPILGATASSYTVQNAQAENAGSFTVTIAAGSLNQTSPPALVTVTPSAPRFASIGPVSPGTVRVGERFRLSDPSGSTPVGSAPITYQWFKDGVVMPGATGETLPFAAASLGDAGIYTQTATNTIGSATSTPVIQTVLPWTNWRWRAPLPQGASLVTVNYQNGVFLAGGEGGTILSSTDGLTWAVQRVPAIRNLYGFAYGQGLHVAIGYYGSLFTSSDLVTWTPRESQVGITDNSSFSSIAFGGGRFVAVGRASTITTSTDGVNWTRGTPPRAPEYLASVTYGTGKFVAIGEAGRIYTSTNGLTWAESATLTTTPSHVAYGAGRFVAVASGAAFHSVDGVTWQRVSVALGSPTSLRFTDAGFLVGLNNVHYLRSFDGLTWTDVTRSVSAASSVMAMTQGAGRYVSVGSAGDTITTSTDGVSWARLAGYNSLALFDVASSGSTTVAVGGSGRISTSTDLDTWTTRDSIEAGALNAVAFSAGTWVAVGDSGTIRTSSLADASIWAARPSTTTSSLRDVVVFKGTFVAVGDSGTVASSPDGATWSSGTTGTSVTLQSVATDGATLVAVGSGGTIRTSANGTSWTNRLSGTSNTLNYVAYGSGRFVAVSFSSEVFTSVDGVSWAPLANSPGVSQGLSYGDGKFYLFGFGGIYYTSPDGLVWTRQSHGADPSLRAATVAGTDIVAVGAAGSILTHPATGAVPVILAQPLAATADAGQAFTLTVTASGYGPLTYQWRKDGEPVAGATAAAYTIPSVSSEHAGVYTVVITSGAGSVTSQAARLTVLTAPGAATLARLLARSVVPSATVGVVGIFTVEGTQPKSVLVRAAGPALTALGESHALADPRLSVTNSAGTEVASNDDWGTAANLAALTSATTETGAFPFAAGSKDAALLATFPPGTYTVRATGAAASGSGAVLLEIYDADTSPRLVYLAARGPVSVSQPLVAGFTVRAPAGRTYLVRGLGPTLGTNGSLADPALTLTAGAVTLAANDNWSGSLELSATSLAVGAQPLASGSADAALLVTLSSGAYTAQVGATGADSGAAMVEIFEFDPVRPATFAPAIVAQPSAVAVVAGRPLALGVVAQAKPAATYEWRKAGASLANGSAAIYTVPVALATTAGAYEVVVTNSAGSVTSRPINVSVVQAHSADSDQNLRIDLFELTRVIQIYNTRSGTVRTGRYRVEDGTEDGFAVDPDGTGGAPGTFVRYHSADTARDARISLVELTRVIELFNTRAGTARTGTYRVESGTEDGFAPGP